MTERERIEVDAKLVTVGDMVPGMGIVTSVREAGQGFSRRVYIHVEDFYIIIAKGDPCKITVERKQ